MITILVVHGPNLNLLGHRQNGIYGDTTLDQINEKLALIAKENKVICKPFFSNYEGKIVDFIQNEGKDAKGLVINPAAFTHTSVAIRDAIVARELSTIEVHLSNIYKREEFRKVSYYHDISIGVITGLGAKGYYFAFEYMISLLKG